MQVPPPKTLSHFKEGIFLSYRVKNPLKNPFASLILLKNPRAWIAVSPARTFLGVGKRVLKIFIRNPTGGGCAIRRGWVPKTEHCPRKKGSPPFQVGGFLGGGLGRNRCFVMVIVFFVFCFITSNQNERSWNFFSTASGVRWEGCP